MGEYQIPPKLIKTVGNFLVEPLTNIINSYFSTSTFPNRTNRASVTPIAKVGTDNHNYRNYRPASVLNTFLKIFDQLTEVTKHANEFLQIFVGAYRKLYSSQHILIRLIEE